MSLISEALKKTEERDNNSQEEPLILPNSLSDPGLRKKLLLTWKTGIFGGVFCILIFTLLFITGSNSAKKPISDQNKKITPAFFNKSNKNQGEEKPLLPPNGSESPSIVSLPGKNTEASDKIITSALLKENKRNNNKEISLVKSKIEDNRRTHNLPNIAIKNDPKITLFSNELIPEQSKVSDRGKNYFEQGLLYHKNGEYLKAAENYIKSLELNPFNSQVLTNLGIIYKDMGESEKSLSYFLEALRLDPENDITHNNLGVLYYSVKQYDNAAKEFKEAIKFNNNNLESFVNLGIIYKKRGDKKEAISKFKEVLSKEANHPEANYNLALAYEEQGDIPLAVTYYEKFLQNASSRYYSFLDQVHQHLEFLQTISKRE